MRYGNPIESTAKSFYSAIHIDLPDVEYEHQTYQERKDRIAGKMKKRRPHEEEVTCVVFMQTWGSTALGFGGIGGQAITSAYTVVVYCDKYACVYFGGGFAYMVEVDSEFEKDVTTQNLCDIRGAQKKYKTIKTGR